MNCPICRKKALVKDTRHQGRITMRKLECTVCENIFYTKEKPVEFDSDFEDMWLMNARSSKN